MKKTLSICVATMLASSLLTTASYASDDDEMMYAVTITNLTKSQNFTPIAVISHKPGHPVYTLGEAASDELAAIAEGGATDPLTTKLMDSGMAYDAASTGALLHPGNSVTTHVKFTKHFNFVSVASMLLPTNDGFLAVNGIKGPKKKGKMKTVMSPAYDAGSEVNDELCANIPGPTCMGTPFSDGQAEGYVYIHSGIHGIGDLSAGKYDWNNPVAKITIMRMK